MSNTVNGPGGTSNFWLHVPRGSYIWKRKFYEKNFWSGGSAKKVGLRIKELERIYGIRNGSVNEKGNNRIGDQNNLADQISQSDLASQMGITTETLRNYKKLTEMIPELEELVDTGIATKIKFQ